MKKATGATLSANRSLPVAAIHAAAFLLPILGLGVAFAVVGLFPFGDKSALTLDLKSQYIAFFSYMRNQVLLGDSDLFYTFAKALGGDMAGLSAYYLLSPFNLLLVLFPQTLLPVGVTVITLLKVGCCGLTMSFLLSEEGAKLESLLFSVPYALMDFVIAFHFNLMWLDGVILLPLVVLGIRRLWLGKGPLLYVLSLAAALVVNYYIGYMLCIFSALYFVVLAFFVQPPERGWRQSGVWKRVGSFAGASLLGAGLSALVVVPAAFSLAGGKAGFSVESFFDRSFAAPADVVSRYMPGTASPAQVFFGYPAIYCGMLALLCAALYFANRQVKCRARLGMGLLLLGLLASFCIGPLDRVWQGFNKPVGFLFRYSFLFSFVLLYLAWQGFTGLRRQAPGHILPLALGGFVALQLVALRDTHIYLTAGKWVLGLALAGVLALLVWVYRTKKHRYIVLALAALVLLDMGASLFLSVRQVDYLPMQQYTDFVQQEQPVVDALKKQDGGFYRMEKNYSWGDNDAFMLGYNGLSHFSSADKMFVRRFLDDAGLSDGGYGIKYADGSTVAMESLLAVKYLITTGAGTVKPFTLLDEQNERMIWQNPLALPVGVTAGEGVLHPMPEHNNIFERYNALWQQLDPAFDGVLYRSIPHDVTLHNALERDIEVETLYEKIGDDSRVEFSVTVDSDDMLYAHFATQNPRNVELYKNGSFDGRFLFNDRHGILPLGRFAPGTVVTVALAPVEYELFLQEVVFAQEDGAALEASVARLRRGGFEPQRHTSSRLSGRVSGNGGQLLLSIPWDSGWHARIDGEKTALKPAFGALTALPLPPGEHSVELWYIPPGLWAGAGVSVASALALVLWCLLRRKAARPA